MEYVAITAGLQLSHGVHPPSARGAAGWWVARDKIQIRWEPIAYASAGSRGGLERVLTAPVDERTPAGARHAGRLWSAVVAIRTILNKNWVTYWWVLPPFTTLRAVLVLGIDPGTRFLGWGLVRGVGNRLQHVAHGVVRAGETQPLPERLVRIDAALSELVETHKPTEGSVESMFYHKDAQAAAKLGHARGVVLLSFARRSVPIAEYAPARVKLTVAGNGRASKDQVAKMVKTLLNLDVQPPADAADALAIAVTHLRRAPLDARLQEALARTPGLARRGKKSSTRRRRTA